MHKRRRVEQQFYSIYFARKLVSDDLGRVFFSIGCKTLPLMGFLVPSESLYIEENIER